MTVPLAVSPHVAGALSSSLLVLSALSSPSVQAADHSQLDKCAAIGAAADRLSCYDEIAGRAPSAPATPTSAHDAAAPAPTSQLAPKDEPVAAASTQQRRRNPSLMSKYWELDPEDKRGTFNLTGYKPSYVMPVHATSRINRSPKSPTQATVQLPDYKSVEAKFQLSFRAKVLQDVGLKDADLWVAFTQQTLWQIWNGKDSKPFRNSDYEPEVMYVIPAPAAWQNLPLGWTWRYVQLGLAHQSNGQADPLSRSWNRVDLSGGFDRGDWSLTGKITHRLKEDRATDNNPDLITYRGRGEFQLTWTPGISTASLLYRTSLTDAKYGALQLELSYPVFKNQPNGVRYYVQLFRGYGETLTDYNFRQTSLGAGISFMQF